jgi:hypothetical protein
MRRGRVVVVVGEAQHARGRAGGDERREAERDPARAHRGDDDIEEAHGPLGRIAGPRDQ